MRRNDTAKGASAAVRAPHHMRAGGRAELSPWLAVLRNRLARRANLERLSGGCWRSVPDQNSPVDFASKLVGIAYPAPS